MKTISNRDDVIDSRDVIERLKELQDERDSLVEDVEAEKPGTRLRKAAYEAVNRWDAENGDELKALTRLDEEGGRCGDWIHGETLVRDDYFVEYAQQFAEDIGAIRRDAEWPNNHIDWEAAAEELQVDYFQVDYGGVTYWIRG